ncbi:trans-sulfuration enzyme family protein [Thermus filiformis]|uniref:Cystathionine gamma-synthase n=1 Tax=Thermus filiformis TaxID=276 RepID=A0A0A2WR32_THEFI|nr:PLP-dependent transferase [Thermus filiformis]KGQ22273.1 cystathionine gamma-synthase [Thermus filiformis]
MERPLKPETWLVVAGRPKGAGSPLNPPIVPASNFLHGAGRAYARDDGNPTWEAFEEVVGGLEGGRALAVSSGMAAAALALGLLPPGGLLVLPTDCYQGVVGLAEEGAALGRFRLRRIPLEDAAAWREAAKEADLLWLESISNPLLEVADLADLAQSRKPGGLLVVDNTFATPLNLRPLELGADLVLHSATKLLGGHSDLLLGVLVARDEVLWARLKKARALQGATPGVLEAFLALRGVRTLAVRLERAQKTAALLAERLATHPRVERVFYPGLPSHPSHRVARRLLKGYGTVVSFVVRGGAEGAEKVLARTRLIQHATSLGGVESTMERRAALPGQEHLAPGLLRLSVGLEAPEDLWADLEEALA